MDFAWNFVCWREASFLGSTSASSFLLQQKLVSLTNAGSVLLPVPADDAGRVSGSRSSDSSSGHAIFTFSNIRKGDEKYYGCQTIPTILDEPRRFEYVRLFVEHRYVILWSQGVWGSRDWGKKGFRAPRQKNWGSRAPYLHSRVLFSQNHYLFQGPRRKRFWAPCFTEKKFGASGLQSSPFETRFIQMQEDPQC